MMFTELLQLAADKKLIVGMCVYPPGASGYHVQIWTGPTMGERTEWCERFPCDIPHGEALDRVAGIAGHALAQTWRREAALSAFFQPAPRHDLIEPNVNQAADEPDRRRLRILHRESVGNPTTPQ